MLQLGFVTGSSAGSLTKPFGRADPRALVGLRAGCREADLRATASCFSAHAGSRSTLLLAMVLSLNSLQGLVEHHQVFEMCAGGDRGPGKKLSLLWEVQKPARRAEKVIHLLCGVAASPT